MLLIINSLSNICWTNIKLFTLALTWYDFYFFLGISYIVKNSWYTIFCKILLSYCFVPILRISNLAAVVPLDSSIYKCPWEKIRLRYKPTLFKYWSLSLVDSLALLQPWLLFIVRHNKLVKNEDHNQSLKLQELCYIYEENEIFKHYLQITFILFILESSVLLSL